MVVFLSLCNAIRLHVMPPPGEKAIKRTANSFKLFLDIFYHLDKTSNFAMFILKEEYIYCSRFPVVKPLTYTLVYLI